MKILITSGGTSEPIDSVRSITNHATGRLGKIISEYFLTRGHEVTLITTLQAQKPTSHSHLNVIVIETVADLLSVMEQEVPKHQALIHSMAVSDYTPVYMTDFDELSKASNPEKLLKKRNQETKISSASDYQVLFLKKTPKIISRVKSWNPDIFLVGFKLLVNVATQELFEVARESLEKNHANVIVANDLSQIFDEQHVAYLIDDVTETKTETKLDLAKMLYERIVV